jgi:hypothetical protein
MVPAMRVIACYISLLIGASLVVTAAIPFIFAYPSNDGPNSGPSSTWELIRMIAYESWILFLIIGLGLSVASILGLRGKILR